MSVTPSYVLQDDAFTFEDMGADVADTWRQFRFCCDSHGPALLYFTLGDLSWGKSHEAARVHHVARRRTHKLANSGKCATGGSRAHRGGDDGACRRCGSPKSRSGFRAGSRKGGLVRRPKPSHRVPLSRM